MNALKIFGLVLLFALALFLNACNAPATQPSAVAQVAATDAPIPTLVSPTDAPTATTAPPTATDVPSTNTPTKIPPTNTPLPTSTPTLPPTATTKPTLKPATKAPTKPPAPAKAFSVDWKTNVGYEGRNATSFWCKFHNQYQNLSAQEFPFQ